MYLDFVEMYSDFILCIEYDLSWSHVEKQFSCSFKVQVLAVIYLNTQLKVHVDLVHIIFPQTEFSNTFHKYRSIKHSSKQSNKVAHKIYSI